MKNLKIFALGAITTICFSLTGCDYNSNNDGKPIILNVYNCAEYIDETVLDDFETYCLETFNEKVEVNYSTYETNEDMFNQIKAGGGQYDLVCPSDYMLQKLIMNDMLEPLDRQIENYDNFGSRYIKDTFDNIETTDSKNNVRKFKEFSVPYMWGTMGFMYDPENISLEAVSSWDVVWDVNYKNQTSLKDSVRDTYIVAALHIYKDELTLAKSLLDDGQYSIKQYNDKVTEIMNRCDDDTLDLIEKALKEAKNNIYEFEVDTGKTNIINGKYYVNLCWSGDAVYALDEADGIGFTLNYKVPEEGSNIWFDGWAMPKGANKKYAQELMNFLCDPKIASRNMNEVGYTSAIAGKDMWDLVLDWYDEGQSEDTIAYDLTYFFKDTNIEDEQGNKITNFIVYTSEPNRQLFAQYPDEQTIQRCAIMKDFGSQNDKVNEMWIKVKSNKVSWVIYVFLGVIIVGVVFFEVKKAYSRRARKNRNRNRIAH